MKTTLLFVSAVAAVKWDANGDPEKLNMLNPGFWEHKANTNWPNMRTSYYDKKNGGVWRSMNTELL